MVLADEVKEIVNGDEVVDTIIDTTIERLSEWKIKNIQPFELAFAVQSVIESIKNSTNQLTVPEGLIFTAVDMICGEFLQKRLDGGNLPEFEVSKALKTLRVGDTTTTYQDSGKSGIELLINSLKGREEDVLSYRKLKW